MKPGHTASPIAYLSAGSNLGDRRSNLERAAAALAATCVVRRVSSCFSTEPVGYTNQPWFLNVALELETALEPMGLLDLCLEIESSLGRERPFPEAPRTLDLDILLVGDLIIDEPRLRIPHPRMAERKFVLVPMVEIAPDAVHPVLHKTMRELLDHCTDRSTVLPYSPGEPA